MACNPIWLTALGITPHNALLAIGYPTLTHMDWLHLHHPQLAVCHLPESIDKSSFPDLTHCWFIWWTVAFPHFGQFPLMVIECILFMSFCWAELRQCKNPVAVETWDFVFSQQVSNSSHPSLTRVGWANCHANFPPMKNFCVVENRAYLLRWLSFYPSLGWSASLESLGLGF